MRVSKFARVFLLASFVLAVAVLAGPALAQSPPSESAQQERPTFKTPANAPEAVPGRIIVKFEEDATRAAQADARRDEGLTEVEELGLIDAEVAKVEGQSIGRAIRDLERRPEVEYAEPDLLSYPAGYADEPRFGELWGLNNTGQAVGGSTGVADVDINGLEASAVTQGDPDLIVAVVDSGVDFTHPDLADRAWVNPGESGGGKETNGVDDDGNGYVDDVNGWNFCNDTPTPFTPGDHPHGTHVAGTVAASVGDGDVVGVAPNVKVMALKFGCGALGSASGADQIRALDYAKAMGAKIANYSYGRVGGPSRSQKESVESYGGLFVASAGNDSLNNDANAAYTEYPASYDSPNILAVAAANNQGNLGYFSNYGATTVDVSAPGVGVLSTLPGNGYDLWNGTSMAAPHVTGVAALAASVTPGLEERAESLKRVILKNTKPLSTTAGKTVTGGMVDALAATDAAQVPAVIRSSPANGARAVSPDAPVQAVFSEAMDPATLTTDNFTLTKQGESTPVPAAVTYDAGTRTAILTPQEALNPDKVTYTAVLEGGAAGAKDLSGEAMDQGESWSFMVSDDLQAPMVSMTSPSDGTRTKDATPVFAGQAGIEPEDLEDLSVKIYRGTITSNTPAATVAAKRSPDGSYSVSPAASLPNGAYTAVATQEDTSGNVGKSLPIGFSVDTRGPTVTVVEGPVVAWGRNDRGQLRTPANLASAKAVEGGNNHTLALKADGTVAAWGGNDYGQTGVPNGLSTVVAVAAGEYHSMALKDEGTVVAWGRNNSRQATVPDGLHDVKAISAGGFHSIALKEDGTVVAWGQDLLDQLNVPGDLSGVEAISAGLDHSLALKEDGTVVAWGSNRQGQASVPVAARSDVEAISAGTQFSAALKEDGTILTWGAFGATTPKIQAPLVDLAAGGNYVLALKGDGTVVAWGDNSYGQTNVPGALSGVRSIDAGRYHALAVTADARPEDPTPSFRFSANEEVRDFECRIDAAAFAPCSSPYTASPLRDGDHALEVRATDLAGNTGTGTRSFTVDAPPPLAEDEANYRTDEDTPLTVGAAQGVLANDADPNEDPLEAVKVSDTGHGAVDLSPDGSFVYTPNPNFDGTDSFTYRATDGGKQSNIATATITVGPVNDAPSVSLGSDQSSDEDAGPQRVEGWATALSAGPPEESGQGLSCVLTADNPDLFSGQPALSPDGTLTYEAAENENGRTRVTVLPKDDGGTPEDTSDDATGEAGSFYVEIRAINDPPTADGDAYPTTANEALSVGAPGILEGDADPDGDALTAAKVVGPPHGTLSLEADGSFKYAPDRDFVGTDTFTYRASDGTSQSEAATVEISVRDAAAPAVTATTPGAGSRVARATANVTATFSEAMDEGSLTETTFTLTRRSTGERVDASVNYFASTNRAVLDPTDELVPGAAYVATVKGGPDGIKDASENALAGDKVWTFGVDSAPKIAILDPEPGSKTTNRRPTVRAVVGDAQSVLSKPDITVRLDERKVTDFYYNRSTGVLSFVPPANLSYGRHEVGIEASDPKGLTGARSWGFGVVR